MWYELVAKVPGKLRTIMHVISTWEISKIVKGNFITKVNVDSMIIINDFYGTNY